VLLRGITPMHPANHGNKKRIGFLVAAYTVERIRWPKHPMLNAADSPGPWTRQMQADATLAREAI
jgi:hypothetical protein